MGRDRGGRLMPARQNPVVARIMRHLFPRVPDFVALLGDQCAVAVEALDAFVDLLLTRRPELAARVRDLEKQGDVLRQRNADVLNHAFATPWDRDLTAAAIRALDDVLNYAKTGVREMEVLKVAPDAAMQEMAGELREGAVALRDAVAAMRGDPGVVEEHVRRVHKCERNVEKAYRRAVAGLFPADGRMLLEGAAPGDEVAHGFDRLLDALRRREVYRHLSNAADRLDDAGRVLLDITVSSV
jgi:uncharacterized protein Yka (UPF0111/DUF47 family)